MEYSYLSFAHCETTNQTSYKSTFKPRILKDATHCIHPFCQTNRAGMLVMHHDAVLASPQGAVQPVVGCRRHPVPRFGFRVLGFRA